jgi:hypothetical protein
MEQERQGVRPDAGGLLWEVLESSLASGANARFEADGRSMLPFVRPGDVLRVRRLADEEPAVGDVVAVQGMPGGGLLVHRVVRYRGDRALIRGDNTTHANGEFSRADILGIVTRVERRGREAWFGAGRWGRLVAWAVRTGLVNRANRACLKFLALASRLREHKGDDGNE